MTNRIFKTVDVIPILRDPAAIVVATDPFLPCPSDPAEVDLVKAGTFVDIARCTLDLARINTYVKANNRLEYPVVPSLERDSLTGNFVDLWTEFLIRIAMVLYHVHGSEGCSMDNSLQKTLFQRPSIYAQNPEGYPSNEENPIVHYNFPSYMEDELCLRLRAIFQSQCTTTDSVNRLSEDNWIDSATSYFLDALMQWYQSVLVKIGRAPAQEIGSRDETLAIEAGYPKIGK